MGAAHRKQKQAETVVSITTAARLLFASDGYDAVTMRDVALAAGMSTGAIFANFSGKDALFEAAMGRKPPHERVRAWLSAKAGGWLVEVDSIGDAKLLLTDLYGASAG